MKHSPYLARPLRSESQWLRQQQSETYQDSEMLRRLVDRARKLREQSRNSPALELDAEAIERAIGKLDSFGLLASLESNASGTPEWPHVRDTLAECRKVIGADRALQAAE